MSLLQSGAVILGVSAMATAPLDHAAQKKQLEALIGATLPFAKKMLNDHGEFFPFGVTMDSDGKVSSVGG